MAKITSRGRVGRAIFFGPCFSELAGTAKCADWIGEEEMAASGRSENSMKTPTRLQVFYASSWPMRLWYFGISSLLVSVSIAAGWAGPWPWQDANNLFVFGVVIVLSWALGMLLAAFPGGLLMGPLLHSRGIENGGPFEVGDRVQILWGPYRGNLATVDEVAQHGGLCVKVLGEGKECQRWVCSAEQLLRESS